MAKRGKTVRRRRGRGRTQRRGRTQKRGRTQRRGRAYRQQGGLLGETTYYNGNIYANNYMARVAAAAAAAAAAEVKQAEEAAEAAAKKYFQDVEVYGKNMLEEYNSLIASGLGSKKAYDAIILRMTREIPEKEYEKLITSRNKGDMTPFRKLKEERTIKDLNKIEREAAESRRAEMIARRAAEEEKKMSLAASPISPPIYIPSQNLPAPSAPLLEDDSPLENDLPLTSSEPPLVLKPLKIEPLNTSKAPMSTRKKAIEFMNELNLTGERSLKFTKRFQELGSNEDALEKIKRDTVFIENLKKDENAGKKKVFNEEQAIAFMNEIQLAPGKRSKFMEKFRELGGDEKALAEIMTYNGDFLKNLTGRPSTTTTAATAPAAAAAGRSKQYDDYTSMMLQHYGVI